MALIQTAAAFALGTMIAFDSWGYMMPHLNPLDTLLLANKQNRAPVFPIALILPDEDPVNERFAHNVYMRPAAANALEEMFEAAKAEGQKLYVLSGFRSYATQKAIFDKKKRERGEKEANMSSAKPGYSEHQTGLAMDFEGDSLLGKGLTAEIGESPEGKWVAENCWKYGFILRYPKGKTYLTGYIYEPWHVRYVGKAASKEIHEMDVTFEEYLQAERSRRIQSLSGGENETHQVD